MNRETLLRYLRENGCVLKREGGAHSLWISADGQMQAVPLHRDVPDILAKSICRKLGLPDPLRKGK